MERVMTHPTLINCLAKIPTRTYDRMMELWTTQKLVFSQSTALVKSLGKPSITKIQAKRLMELGLTHDSLKILRSQSADETFKKALIEKGVKSKPLREKLTKLVPVLAA